MTDFHSLKDDYFANYKRVVYLVQKPDPALIEQAKAAATYLGLPLEIRATGLNWLERRLAELFAAARCNQVNRAGQVVASSSLGRIQQEHMQRTTDKVLLAHLRAPSRLRVFVCMFSFFYFLH